MPHIQHVLDCTIRQVKEPESPASQTRKILANVRQLIGAQVAPLGAQRARKTCHQIGRLDTGQSPDAQSASRCCFCEIAGNAWVTANHISLGQVVADEKSNEITAMQKLLEIIDISGALVTSLSSQEWNCLHHDLLLALDALRQEFPIANRRLAAMAPEDKPVAAPGIE
jgi:hypothetical protein